MIRLGITMGCPAGIGPDVIVKAAKELRELSSPVIVLGDPQVLYERAKKMGLSFPFRKVSSPLEARAGEISILPLSNLDIEPGRPSLDGFRAMVRYIKEGVSLCLEGQLSGLVTAPISKEGLQAVGEPYPGHTEMLAELTRTREYAMAFYGERLAVALVTIHLSLKAALTSLSIEKILRVTRLAYHFLKKDLGLEEPRLALSALNPHAGEGGLFGNEEKEILEPAVERARKEGLPLSGPYPADSLFFRAATGEFDMVIALYHDQGLIPFKLLHFQDGVNLTLGLPIIRTSVDHGTAYDIAGTGKASPQSLIAAVRLAYRMAKHRHLRSQAPSDPEPPYK
ncbi:4-hydroxythreonine-4-phosphate dehydrogenase PdxA [Thermosulfurimonas dismutans]|uniref:4-hydroxythreonine-4-phosphate dehydrogenase PdxA n=1 Tax=Thermosulfurimonas dismutans TaxID=999894 RepID=UPI0008395F37|nr:4-hydroxythreonine-4-phosphate dehydrogenase PdxA [Thermosulfurimonas dismutans]